MVRLNVIIAILASSDTLSLYEREASTGRSMRINWWNLYYPTYLSMSNSILLEFKSNSVHARRGFKIKYQSSKGITIKNFMF